ncbi:CarD family transcriptional regulator [Ornithinibacillus californiensis]|uniref:CarD family transcriptional regulator n=1 Tax=Ornithinibacillus californiensis TaxID=161536 RepID=UPI00064DDE6E|nr:CarD family transcriptional regulator [Ornithinibacillus californiensis]
MFNIGELVVYSDHGVCKIDSISEKTYGGKTRTYYELHPIEDSKLRINIPVNNVKVNMLKMMNKDQADTILKSFEEPGVEWIEDVKIRNKEYNKLIQSGDRLDISKVVNTLMKRKQEMVLEKRHIPEQDKKLLSKTLTILIEELAISLDKHIDEIEQKILHAMKYQVN